MPIPLDCPSTVDRPARDSNNRAGTNDVNAGVPGVVPGGGDGSGGFTGGGSGGSTITAGLTRSAWVIVELPWVDVLFVTFSTTRLMPSVSKLAWMTTPSPSCPPR